MSRGGPAGSGREADHSGGVVIWHEVECGPYSADLPLWRELAGEADGPVLELGSGTGRVALDLADTGHDVVALDRDAELLAELKRHAAASGLEVEVAHDDCRSFALGRRFALIIAPMQLAQLLGGPSRRSAMLEAAAGHLEPDGRLVLAIVSEEQIAAGERAQAGAAADPPFPDVRERDGWVYSSLPIEVRVGEAEIEVRRLRQAVSPTGELSEQVDVTRLDRVPLGRLVEEARGAGLAATGRREIAPTADHVGSTAVILEAG